MPAPPQPRLSADAWRPRFALHVHGRERQPVIVVDNFARDPERLIEEAAGLAFAPNGPLFPGVRAPVPLGFCMALRQSLEALIQKTFGVTRPLDRLESWYSLVTRPASAQSPMQRLPHVDGVGAQRIALVHHLGRSGLGGTAFFRHRATGYETLDAPKMAAYLDQVNAALAAGQDMAELYDQIAVYPARFNRLLIYRGDSLHGAALPPDDRLTGDPRTGRFSINSFFWLEAP